MKKILHLRLGSSPCIRLTPREKPRDFPTYQISLVTLHLHGQRTCARRFFQPPPHNDTQQTNRVQFRLRDSPFQQNESAYSEPLPLYKQDKLRTHTLFEKPTQRS
jgi:hypothetical protein